jgi:hypothetical protein
VRMNVTVFGEHEIERGTDKVIAFDECDAERDSVGQT